MSISRSLLQVACEHRPALRALAARRCRKRARPGQHHEHQLRDKHAPLAVARRKRKPASIMSISRPASRASAARRCRKQARPGQHHEHQPRDVAGSRQTWPASHETRPASLASAARRCRKQARPGQHHTKLSQHHEHEPLAVARRNQPVPVARSTRPSEHHEASHCCKMQNLLEDDYWLDPLGVPHSPHAR